MLKKELKTTYKKDKGGFCNLNIILDWIYLRKMGRYKIFLLVFIEFMILIRFNIKLVLKWRVKTVGMSCSLEQSMMGAVVLTLISLAAFRTHLHATFKNWSISSFFVPPFYVCKIFLCLICVNKVLNSTLSLKLFWSRCVWRDDHRKCSSCSQWCSGSCSRKNVYKLEFTGTIRAAERARTFVCVMLAHTHTHYLSI